MLFTCNFCLITRPIVVHDLGYIYFRLSKQECRAKTQALSMKSAEGVYSHVTLLCVYPANLASSPCSSSPYALLIQ